MPDPTPQDPTPTAPQDPAPAPTPPSDPAPTPPTDSGKQPPWGDPENFNAEKAWELIQNLRTEKGDPTKVAELEQTVSEMRTAQQTQMDAIAKALGLKSDDTPPDPEVLTAQLAERDAAAAAAQRELAVFKAAPGAEANAAALLDSASFLESIKAIDPTDADALTAAIKAKVEVDDRFKATPSPTSPPFPGGPRTPAPTGAGSLGEAIANKIAGQRRS